MFPFPFIWGVEIRSGYSCTETEGWPVMTELTLQIFLTVPKHDFDILKWFCDF